MSFSRILRYSRYGLSLLSLFFSAGASTARAGSLQTNPVVFVHYDYMVSADGHSHAPLKASLDQVVEAYRKHGITLVIDPQHTAIPQVGTTMFPAGQPAPDRVDFGVLKATYFHPKDKRAWHYAIFANDVSYFGDPVGGAAELPGYDFVVAGTTIDAVAGIPQARILLEGGLFMHELGHNLDLRHGGATNFPENKPNYISVMSGLYTAGISTSPVPGTLTKPFSHRVDYSDRVLPTLDESALNEFAGVGTGNGDIIRWMANSRATGFFFPNLRSPGIGPIDWDLSGTIDNSEEWDINLDFISGPESNSPQYWIFRGFDDWSHIRAFINSPRYQMGLVTPVLPADPCPSKDTLIQNALSDFDDAAPAAPQR